MFLLGMLYKVRVNTVKAEHHIDNTSNRSLLHHCKIFYNNNHSTCFYLQRITISQINISHIFPISTFTPKCHQFPQPLLWLLKQNKHSELISNDIYYLYLHIFGTMQCHLKHHHCQENGVIADIIRDSMYQPTLAQ